MNNTQANINKRSQLYILIHPQVYGILEQITNQIWYKTNDRLLIQTRNQIIVQLWEEIKG